MTSRAPWFGLFVLAAFLGGCAEPEAIRVQDEPRSSKPKPEPIPDGQKKFRTFGAAFPADGDARDGAARWWFVKLSGPVDVVAKYAADAQKLIESIQTVPDERMIVWTVPAGWKEKRKDGPDNFGKLAVLHAPDGDARITITKTGGMLLMNVNRWWGQLWGKERSGEITGATLPDYARQVEVKGRMAFTIDLVGPNDPNPNPTRFRTIGAIYQTDGGNAKDPQWWFLKLSGPSDVVALYAADAQKIIDSVKIPGADGKPIEWTLPPGWTKDDRVRQFRHATILAPDKKTELTVTQIGGAVPLNVGRWRDQLWGSDELDITDANLEKYATKTTIGGRTAYKVDLLGPNDPVGGPGMGGGMMPPHGGMAPHGGQ